MGSGHEKRDVYRAAIEYVAWVYAVDIDPDSAPDTDRNRRMQEDRQRHATDGVLPPQKKPWGQVILAPLLIFLVMRSRPPAFFIFPILD